MTRMHDAFLVASGDLRRSANREGWPNQRQMEREVTDAFQDLGVEVRRTHTVDEAEGHGFNSSQRMGMDVFASIPPEAPVIVAEAVWQYSDATTPQWPVMHAVLDGVSRDQMMARHRANHIQVAYAPSAPDADRALAVKAAMFAAMGVQVHLCGCGVGPAR